jgi:hypothetical protein
VTDYSQPLPETIYRKVVEILGTLTGRDRAAAGVDPEASQAQWALKHIALLKPARDARRAVGPRRITTRVRARREGG